MSSELGKRLKAHWQSQGLEIRPGVTQRTIEKFEKRYGVILPVEFREYLATINGTGPSEYDSNFNHFWSIEEFRSIQEKHPDASVFEDPSAYFLFADFSINLPAFAIRLSNDYYKRNQIIRVYSDMRLYSWENEAGSFTELAEHYLAEGILI